MKKFLDIQIAITLLGISVLLFSAWKFFKLDRYLPDAEMTAQDNVFYLLFLMIIIVIGTILIILRNRHDPRI